MNKTTHNNSCSRSEASPKKSARKLQLFRTGSLHLAVFSDYIATIAEWQEPTPLPRAPQSVLGVVSIHGRMLTILNPAILLGEEVAQPMPHTHIVALRGDQQLALAADGIGGLAEISSLDLESPAESLEKPIEGRFYYDGDAISIIGVNKLFVAAIQGRERRRRRF